jgi:hypothetical protein
VKVGLVETLKARIADNSAWPDRAVKPRKPRSGAPQARGLTAKVRSKRSSSTISADTHSSRRIAIALCLGSWICVQISALADPGGRDEDLG